MRVHGPGQGMIGTVPAAGPVVSFAVKPVLTGELVMLRPVSTADVDGLAELVANPEVRRLTGTHAHLSRARLKEWYATRAAHADRLDLAIVERATSRYVGELALANLDPPNRSCSLRIALIGPRVFGRGFGTEAMRLVLEHAFTAVGLHRVELEVYAFNHRARHVYDSVGFVHEGTKRDALHTGDGWVDAHIMGILAGEWARHHGRP